MRRMQRREQGFTLIELMVVIVILGLLGTLVAPKFTEILEQAKADTTANQILTLEKTIDLYRVKQRKLPDSLADLQTAGLINEGELPVDGWGQEFRYTKVDARKFELVSLGADATEGGTDELDMDMDREKAHARLSGKNTTSQ